MNTTQEIYSITFGINSEKEIVENSVCCINNVKKSGTGSVYDPRMGAGAGNGNGICETCGETVTRCTGHVGHIELATRIVHPLFYRTVERLLNCVCFKCNRLMVTETQLSMEGIMGLKGLKRFETVFEKSKKVSMCCHVGCGCEKPKLKFSPINNNYTIYHDSSKSSAIVLNTDEIYSIFNNITDKDTRLMGLDPVNSHPRNYILSVLPVLPPVDRPFIKVNGNMWDDDITIQYIEIVKTNLHLKEMKDEMTSETNPRYVKMLNNLIFRISTMFNNSQSKARHTGNGRPIKGIKERLAGKDGQIRGNIMGKRVNQTARTVVGPDPTLKTDQIAIPEFIAQTLTFPERVTRFNMEQLQRLVDSGVVETVQKDDDNNTTINVKRYMIGTRVLPGDYVTRGDTGERIKVEDGINFKLRTGDRLERNGKDIPNIKPSDRRYLLKMGMVVNRPLRDDDTVLLNRQPTLHKGSMLAMRVKLRPCKTIRMNLSVCKSFNADFDGDEMNLHAPQGLEALIELQSLAATKNNIIAAQSSKPNFAIVQDSLLGAFRMTKGIVPINKGRFFDMCMHLDLKFPVMKRIQHVRRVLKNSGKKAQCFNGKGMISMFLPCDLDYDHKNGADPDEPVVKIRKGVMLEGALDKSILGSSHVSLIHLINKEYGPDESMYFIDCIQFCTTQFLLLNGFTVGLGDCLISDKEKKNEVRENIRKCFIEADGIKTTTTHKGVCEMRVNGALNKAKDIGLKIAKDSLGVSNNFVSTVTSGSKGDFFNIAQITGLLGQQNLGGARVPLTMNNGKRSLPHYPFENMTSDMEYESRGFISSSFIEGLNPREFYFHAMSGREGITDTAMGTATSGYMQRRIVKLTEDIICQYDGTVRDVTGRMYQTVYGDDGIDPTTTTKVNGKQEICNVDRIVNRLNQCVA